MVETALLTLAPLVLDMLFGGKEDVEGFHHPTKMYSGGLYSGAGYRYPKTKRSIVVTYPYSFTKAAVFNKAIAERNPWVEHLRNTHTYDKIRQLLQEAKKSYVPDHPERTNKSRESRVKILQGIVTAINMFKDELKKEYKYPTPSYDTVLEAE